MPPTTRAAARKGTGKKTDNLPGPSTRTRARSTKNARQRPPARAPRRAPPSPPRAPRAPPRPEDAGRELFELSKLLTHAHSVYVREVPVTWIRRIRKHYRDNYEASPSSTLRQGPHILWTKRIAKQYSDLSHIVEYDPSGRTFYNPYYQHSFSSEELTGARSSDTRAYIAYMVKYNANSRNYEPLVAAFGTWHTFSTNEGSFGNANLDAAVRDGRVAVINSVHSPLAEGITEGIGGALTMLMLGKIAQVRRRGEPRYVTVLARFPDALKSTARRIGFTSTPSNQYMILGTSYQYMILGDWANYVLQQPSFKSLRETVCPIHKKAGISKCT